ncbi:HD domain-containing protein [Alkalibacillus aidingensis]|uniref:HD domain-containing protein n=1 Tax=Alkalibacillus aidingensis TaxID=2747607 RepID=UPI0016610300|nr:HD domain-containing protein [Alkalibacillus aidingensis]
MNKEKVIELTITFVRQELSGEGSGHDWWHIYRVTEMTKTIAQEEGADQFICTMAALLHDLADEKVAGSEEKGLATVREWLTKQEIPLDQQGEIIEIIQTISFKGGHGKELTSIEAQVVQDADRLDAIGAIGIARCFTFGGSKGHLMHDPEEKPKEQMTEEEYRKRNGTAVNHFYEKLLKLKDLMNTSTGKELAKERHRFMQDFLEQFYAEWDGRR